MRYSTRDKIHDNFLVCLLAGFHAGPMMAIGVVPSGGQGAGLAPALRAHRLLTLARQCVPAGEAGRDSSTGFSDTQAQVSPVRHRVAAMP
jgi:hypothetical protein